MENQFSKIILGTVQLGMPYGVGQWANELMPENEAFKILDAAWEMGITTLDTSPDYGCAELRIAKYMTTNPAKNFHIISKIKNITQDPKNVGMDVKNWFANCQFRSLKNCASLSLLLHDEKDICRPDVLEQLNGLTYKSKIAGWGISVYKDYYAREAAAVEECKMVQLPFSVLNQSFGRLGTIKLLSRNKKAVFARSVFLKGLLLTNQKKLSLGERERLSMTHTLLGQLRSQDIALNDFAMSIAINEYGVSNLVLGADTHEHVRSWCDKPQVIRLSQFPNYLLRQLRYHENKELNPEHWS